jgi:serine/threonine-protein kinase
MSPEQAKGSLKIDNRTDIFSLGCVLYEMFTGRQTFHGDSVPEVLASVLARDADLSRLPANLNPRLYELIRRCLEKDLKKRWHAVGDVRVELEAIASDARGIEVSSSTATRVSRKKVAALVLAGIALVPTNAAGNDATDHGRGAAADSATDDPGTVRDATEPRPSAADDDAEALPPALTC